jgi:DNA-binding GntR family transcriptional regulator
VIETDLTGIRLEADLRDRRITADYVADALRNAIQQGALADGAVLNQAAIAAHFGVSRVPVREAMRQLQAEGLIDTRAHRLAVVRGLDIHRLEEVYDLRALIEGYLVLKALPKVDSALIAELKAIDKEMRGEDDHSRWLALNARFHDLLYTPSGDETALELVEQLRLRAERYVRLWSRGSGVQRHKEVGREHQAIIKAVAAGDAEGARSAVEEHIHHTRDRVIAQGEQLAKAGNGGAH